MPKLKNATDRQVTVKGYAVEVEKQDGFLTLGTGLKYPFVLPDDYVCVTLNDDFGREFYILAHKNTPIGG